jgi:radical SAM protein with 4Fe4S-binding SPASM domain
MINIASCHDPARFGEDVLLDRDGYLRLAETINRLRPAHLGRLDVTGSHDLGYFSWSFPHLGNFQWQGCRAGIDTLGIHSNGDVKGCLILPDAFVEGNIRKTRVADLWRDPDRFQLVRAFRHEMLEGSCRGCAFGDVCKGGCKDLAASTTGSPYRFPFCLRVIENAKSRPVSEPGA